MILSEFMSINRKARILKDADNRITVALFSRDDGKDTLVGSIHCTNITKAEEICDDFVMREGVYNANSEA